MVAMNGVGANAQASFGYRALDDNWYNLTATHSERKPTSKDPENEMLAVRLTAIDGPFAGSSFTHYFNLWHKEEANRKRAESEWAAFCAVCGFHPQQVQDSSMLHNAPFRGRVTKTKSEQGNDMNSLKELTSAANEPVDACWQRVSGGGQPQQAQNFGEQAQTQQQQGGFGQSPQDQGAGFGQQSQQGGFGQQPNGGEVQNFANQAQEQAGQGGFGQQGGNAFNPQPQQQQNAQQGGGFGEGTDMPWGGDKR